ncbi:MAG TPA: secretin N-terminal domain-containing protein, partial [Phycisphaerae bacterium]|nr:secretin N-terminal domain-containing protein [Phycisphaerae bacterium]
MLALAALIAVGWLTPLPARGDEPQTAAEIEQRINELASRSDLTDAEMDELVDLGQKYTELMAKSAPPAPATPDKAAPPTPRSRATPAPTPRPTAGRRGVRARPTPTPTPVPRNIHQRPGRPVRPTPTPAAGAQPTGDELEAPLNKAADEFLKPYDEREYQFSLKDATYAELIENFGRMASLPVIGTAPPGSVTFVSADVMDFKTALGRVQMLLFKHPDQYWLRFHKDKKYLEVVRMADIKRYIPLDRIYTSLAAYRADHLDDNEVAMLLYTPESGSIGELEPLRDFMPDYFMTAPYPDKNAQTIFGLVGDINKYLDLIDKLTLSIDEPRVTKIIPVEHVKPSAALETLKELVDFGPSGPGATPSKRRGSQPSQGQVLEYGVTAIASDERGTLLVRAMPKKIEEIERFLKFVDLPLEEDEYTPVVVPVVHADAGKVMNLVKAILGASDGGNASPSKPVRRSAAARRRAARAKTAAAAAPLSTDTLTMLHWEPTNSIILIGEDEEVEHARELIGRFDVVEDVDTRFVDIKFRTAEEMCTLSTALLTATKGGEEPTMTCTPESSGTRVILAGPTRDVDEAQDLIAKLDIEDTGEEDTIHTIVLECMKPSDAVNLLKAWDTEEPTTPTTPASGRRRAARRRAARASTGGKFVPDDVNRSLRVISTDTDWTDRYKPMIDRIDHEACGGVEHVVLDVTNVDPSEAIATLSGLVGPQGKGQTGPTMIPVARGVMVVGATPTELDLMKQVLSEVDVDPIKSGLLVRRTFELENVEAAEIVPVLEALTDSGSTPAPAKRPRRGRAAAQAASAGADISFVEHGNRLWVSAPPADMDRIADLIEELDVPEAERDLRPYDFEPGINVTELAETLRQLFPENSRVAASAKPTPRNRRARRAATAGAASGGAEGDAILFIPQAAARRIFVSAPLDMFPEIEQTIELVRPESGPQGKVVVKFYPLESGEPDNVAAIVEPLAQMKIAELIEAGELPEQGKDQALLRITPDPVSNRLVVAAPSAVIPDIEKLIEEVESGEHDAPVTKLVTLQYASANDIAEKIGMLVGASGSSPARPAPTGRTSRRGGRGRAPRAAPAAATPASSTTTPTGVTVVPLQSNDTVMVHGPQSEVDQVLDWIDMLDTEVNKDRIMRVYQLAYADVEKLADDIMTVLDSGGGAPAPKAASEEDDFFGDLGLSMGGPRRGQDISLTTNYYTNTMIVWASPRKMAEIDDYIKLFEEEQVTVQETLPSEVYKMKYADAYEAKYDLQEYIDALWSGEKPKIEYIAFNNALALKSRKPDEDFPRLEKILAEHIDTPDKAGAKIRVERQAISGAPASDVVSELIARMGGQVE